MIDIDFINILRLDSCFKFLSLQERIHLHQGGMSERYFSELPKSIRDKITKMDAVLKMLDWEVPGFSHLREDEDAHRYWVFKSKKGELSTAEYAKIYQEKFNQFKQMI